MAWNITERFPLWGEDGEFPSDGFFYEGGDQVNEKHLDALWNGLKEFEGEVSTALDDLDADGDGIVDEADYANDADASTYKGNDLDANGDGKVNAAENADYATSAGDADTLDGEDATAFADTNHGNEEHSETYLTSEDVNLPSGVITMWSGTTSDVPSGWTLCDGTDGTPDLRNRFVAGAGGQYSVGDTGGEDAVSLTASQNGPHSHSVLTHWDNQTQGSSGNTIGVGSEADVFEDQPIYETEADYGYNYIGNSGSGDAHENRPPFYALAYIMKL